MPRILLIALSLALFAPLARAADGMVPVRVGKTIELSLEESKKANFAWRPKQTLEEGKETKIYLPYGAPNLFWQADNVTLADPAPGKSAEAFCTANDRPMLLTYRFQFDKPIDGFRCYAGYCELVLAPECVSGVEYSIDGKAWTTLVEHPAGTRAVVKPFSGPEKRVTGLDTKTLFLRLYARQKADPAATGKECYFKLRNAGDPAWGDAASSLYEQQMLLWVHPRCHWPI